KTIDTKLREMLLSPAQPEAPTAGEKPEQEEEF
ncbi:recombinase RecA, partial [Vibrio chemaguriensis]|nr:recombinase RecA [Vibrio chemaguriensis]